MILNLQSITIYIFVTAKRADLLFYGNSAHLEDNFSAATSLDKSGETEFMYVRRWKKK